MKILFMGTPDFSVPSLEAVVAAGHEVVAVVTQPDKQRGRGKAVSFSPVKEKALELGLPVLQPESVRDESVIKTLTDLQAQIIVVIAYGKILPSQILTAAPYGCINIHASLLPKYRGAAPIQYAVLNGDEYSGISIMKLDEGMDTGDVLLQEKIRLASDETTGSLFEKLSLLGRDALLKVLADPDSYEKNAVRQDHEAATYTQKIDKSMARINWQEDAIVIERTVRTLEPSPGAYTFLDKKRLKIHGAHAVQASTDNAPGTVISVSKSDFTVQTGARALKVTSVQPESRKTMTSAQFLQSHDLQIGAVLGIE